MLFLSLLLEFNRYASGCCAHGRIGTVAYVTIETCSGVESLAFAPIGHVVAREEDAQTA